MAATYQYQQYKISVPNKADTTWGTGHPRPSMLHLEEKEPMVFKIMRAKKNRMEAQKKAELNLNDSIRLNLITIYGTDRDVFSDNCLTRILHPADTLAFSSKLPLATDITASTDSLSAATADSTITVVPVKKAVVIQPAIAMPEKEVKPKGFSTEIGWLGPLLLLLLVFAGLIRIFSGKYIGNLFKSLFNQQNADNLYKMVNVHRSLPAYCLDLLFNLNLGIFSYLGLRYMGLSFGGIHPLAMYGIICSALLLLMVVKTSVYRFLAYVFGIAEGTNEFLFYVFLYTRTASLVLLPFSASVAFVDSWLGMILIETGVALLAFMYVLQLIQGIKIFLRKPAAIFYMFLYLCALEMLPVLVIFKTLSR